MKEFGDVMSHVTTLTVLVFILVYGFGAPWWRTPIGRNIFALALAHLLIFSLISANLIWGLDWAGRQAVRVSTFSSIAAIMAWRTVIFVREQLKARQTEKSGGPNVG